ncbi:hypothetical protein [Lacrimispora sp. 210928-DFI.3.58]|nr:hypothetical protein [Lacrimispora sp. 210928-DFI.3.58]
MADKNPKHPPKKKKEVPKVNVADHTAAEQAQTGKKKKHVY